MVDPDGDINNLANRVVDLFSDENLKISFNEYDRFAYMASYFYAKQRNHLISILTLKDNYDAQLICRCMIEGYLQLAHAENDKDIAEKWVTSSNIENLRVLKQKDEAGIQIDKETRNKIMSYLANSEDLLKEKSKRDIEQTGREHYYKDYKSPIVRHISSLKEKLSDKEEMFLFYDEFSKWQHWNISSFSTFLDIENKCLNLNEVNPSSSMITNWSVFCLLLTSEIFNRALDLKKEQQISDYLDELVNNY